MLLHIKTNGATDLVVNISSSGVQYSQQMVDLFENNIVAIKDGSLTEEDHSKVILTGCIRTGNKLILDGPDDKPKILLVPQLSEQIITDYDPQPLEAYVTESPALTFLQNQVIVLEDEKLSLQQRIEELEALLEPETPPDEEEPPVPTESDV